LTHKNNFEFENLYEKLKQNNIHKMSATKSADSANIAAILKVVNELKQQVDSLSMKLLGVETSMNGLRASAENSAIGGKSKAAGTRKKADANDPKGTIAKYQAVYLSEFYDECAEILKHSTLYVPCENMLPASFKPSTLKTMTDREKAKRVYLLQQVLTKDVSNTSVKELKEKIKKLHKEYLDKKEQEEKKLSPDQAAATAKVAVAAKPKKTTPPPKVVEEEEEEEEEEETEEAEEDEE
jgi:hypothetical protein